MKDLIGVIYRPNSQPKADIDIFISTLNDILEIINDEKKKMTLMGDFNIDLLSYTKHEKTNTFIDSIFSSGFIPQITKPTRITQSSATLIDHIYTNEISPDPINGIITNDVADHCGIFHMRKSKTKQTESNTQIKKRFYSETNIEYFREILNDTDFTFVNQYNCPNEAYNHFIMKYKEAFDKAFPEKLIQPNKRYIAREPWVSREILEASKRKRKLLNLKNKRPSPENLQNYIQFRNEFNHKKRRLKFEYFRDKLNENKHSMKNTWNIIKTALNKQNDKSNFPHSFEIDGKQVTNPLSIATSFNKYYTDIGKITSQNVPKSNRKYTDYLKNPNINSIFIEPVDEHMISEIVNKLKPKLSSGHDHIPTKILKQSIDKVIAPVTYIINISLMAGIFPDALKLAKVVPIYKSSKKNELRSYRPVSILPAFSKIFEKIMNNKLTSFFDSQNLFYPHQYGFRSKHSTVHPILHLLNTCAEANNSRSKSLTMSIMCDLSKAFDVISHDILIKKLDYYGIRGLAKNWLISYLSNRKQFVDFSNNLSDPIEIEYGVPQGSILGPLLYLIYVNDIGTCTNGHIYSFADDTTLVISDEKPDVLFQKSNIAVDKLYNWFCANGLSLNPQKTKYIIIKSPRSNCDFTNLEIKINGSKLERIGLGNKEKSTKFLGVHIDEYLNWKPHLNFINGKISRALFGIRQVKNILPKDCLKTLYHAIIHPYIDYCLLAWGGASSSTLNRTNTLQKKALRVISKSNYNSHTEPILKQLKILKLRDQYELNVTLFMHKYINNKLPSSFQNIFKLNHQVQINHNTRQANQMYISRCFSNFSEKLPLFEFPKIWNKWRNEISCLPENVSLNKMKKTVTSVMLDAYASHIQCQNPLCKDCRNLN